jgi:hypothetical protein
MYYICKFSESWSLYDASNQTSRLLDKIEVDSLKSLFPALLSDNKILSAIEVTSIQPNKLMKLQNSGNNTATRKSSESSLKLN